jgi:N-glycosylase/DNA lyase
MKKLLESIENLKKGEVKKSIDQRTEEFRELGKKPSSEIFKELCFCILTANFNAEKGIKIQQEIGEGFLTLPEGQLSKRLKELGHRYPNTRAKYIAEARKYRDLLEDIAKSSGDGNELREWLVKNVRGLGYKEASHFLRNTGCTNFAIIDFHIVDILSKHGLIEKPKTVTKGKYIEIEKFLKKIAEKLNLNLAELDLYLWYMETGKVLK